MYTLKKIAIEIVFFLKTLNVRIKNMLNLSGNGERVDITVTNGIIDMTGLDMYQISHIYRYKYALETIAPGAVVGDFACGTGYGTVLLSQKAKSVTGIDINCRVIKKIQQRYINISNVSFVCSDLLAIAYERVFDTIVSFETLEHLTENNIKKLLTLYNKALSPNGILIFSTPYMQQQTKEAVTLGFHLTFTIDENKITSWLKDAGFAVVSFAYQNYQTHSIETNLAQKDFIICIAKKI